MKQITDMFGNNPLEVPPTMQPPGLSKEEYDLVLQHREGLKPVNPATSADAIVKRNPLAAILVGTIRAVLPKGYGTYVSGSLLILASIASILGYAIPFFELPPEYAGATGLATAVLLFLRDAMPKQ